MNERGLPRWTNERFDLTGDDHPVLRRGRRTTLTAETDI